MQRLDCWVWVEGVDTDVIGIVEVSVDAADIEGVEDNFVGTKVVGVKETSPLLYW